MKVEHDASLQAHQVAEPPTRVGATGGAAGSAAGERASRLSAAVIDHLSSKETRFLAHAPGRLDIMGGFAEYSGSLVLNTTVADNVCDKVVTWVCCKEESKSVSYFLKSVASFILGVKTI